MNTHNPHSLLYHETIMVSNSEKIAQMILKDFKKNNLPVGTKIRKVDLKIQYKIPYNTASMVCGKKVKGYPAYCKDCWKEFKRKHGL